MPIVRLVIYFAVLGSALLPALYINTLEAYLPLIFLLLISLCSIVYSLLLAVSFSMDQNLAEDEYVRLKSAKVGVRVFNRGILVFPRVGAVFSMTGPNDYRRDVPVNITMSPREKSWVGITFAFPHVDKYTIRIHSVRIYGLLGVLGMISRKKAEREITVMPRLEEIDFDIAAEYHIEGAVLSNVKNLTDSSSYSGVRDYEVGDPLKRIHWKLSAHEQKYKTRLPDDDNNITINIMIDGARPESSGENLSFAYDCLVESALSVAANSLSYDNKTAIFFRDQGELNQISPLTREQAVNVIIDRVKFGDDNGIGDCLLSNQLGGLMVVCTCVLSDDLVHNLAYLKGQGKNPILIYAPPPDRGIEKDAPLLHTVAGSRIEHYVVKDAKELKSKMEKQR